MDFDYLEEQEAVKESAEAVFGGHATPERVAGAEAGDPVVDTELATELARAHLTGITVPEAQGGSGLGILEACALLVEQGRRVAPVPLLPTVIGALALSRFGDPATKDRVLSAVARGEASLAVALPSPGESPTVQVSASSSLDGVYPSVRGATLASHIVVVADRGCFVVDSEAPGCRVERLATTDRQEHGRVSLDSVEGVAIGEESRAGEVAGWLAAHYTVGLCALQLGVCQEAVKLAARYVTERHQFGKPLASFQGVALRAADAHIDTEAMSVTLWQAAWRLSEGLVAEEEVAVAKWWASEAGHRVVHAAQHLHGGMGADVTYPVHRYFLWAKQIELEMGAGAAQLATLGDLVCAR